MTDEGTIFRGRVITTNTGLKFTTKCYDALQRLNSEHIPLGEGVYTAVDAGAIIKDIITGSGHDIDAGGVSVSTGVIVDKVDLTDKVRLEAIKLMMYYVNGANEEGIIYHLRDDGGFVVFAPRPEYTNDTPAITLTDADIIPGSFNIKQDGTTSFFNCATCKGADDVRAYYPQTLDPEGNPIPDFPANPSHYLIEETSLFGVDACYAVARGWVRSHDQIPKEVSVAFSPDRFDFFPGQTVRIDSVQHNVLANFLIRTVSWNNDLKKRMSFKLSSVDVQNLAGSITKI